MLLWGDKMKPFYCSKKTNGKWKFNDSELVIKKASKDLLNRIDRLFDEEDEYKRKHVYLHKAFYTIQLIFGIVGLFTLIPMLFCLQREMISLSEPIWCYSVGIGLFCLVGEQSIEYLIKKRERNYEESEICAEYKARIDAMFDSIYSEMGVPINAPDVDILCFNYKLEGSDVVPIKVGRYGRLYRFGTLRFYNYKKKLCMASDEEVYAIDISGIKSIKRIEKPIRFEINKMDKERIARFKKHSIKRKFGVYTIESHYIMEFEHNGDLWSLYFPWYELPVIEELTGFKG